MSAAANAPVRVISPRPKRSRRKLIAFAVFALVTVFVTYGKNQEVLNSQSAMAQHYAPGMLFLIPHAIFATIAMALGGFQFSNRLRAKYLKVHRALGYVYIACVFVGAPLGSLVAYKIQPGVFMGSIAQTVGWMFCTGVALYCIKTGNIAEHRKWMIRGYPFAMVFTFARAIIPLFVTRYGQEAVINSTVWSCVFVAGFVPSVLLAWKDLRRAPKLAAAAHD